MSGSDAGSSAVSEQGRLFISKYILPLGPKGTAPGTKDEKVLPIWASAKTDIDEQVSALQNFLKSSDAPLFKRIADSGLHGVTSGQFVSLQASLMDFDAASLEQKQMRLPKLTSAIKEMKAFVDTNKAVALMDDNPFKINCAIRTKALAALSQISSVAQRTGGTAEG